MGNALSGSGECREAVVALGPPSEEFARRLEAFGVTPNEEAAREALRRASNTLQIAVERIVSSQQMKVPLGDRALLLKANTALVNLSSALTTLLCERRPLPEARVPKLRAACAERTLADAPRVIATDLPADATEYLRRAVRHVEQLSSLLKP